jgi:hypothetical protein
MKLRLACCIALLGTVAVASAATSSTPVIVVSIEPAFQSFPNPGGTTTVDIVADIPEAAAIVGWGLDVTLSNGAVSIVPPPVIGPSFDAAFAPDGDGLAGLVPPADPDLFGNDIVLATLTISLDSPGVTDLTPSHTAGDLTEGFLIGNNGFADIDYIGAQIEVLPEPTTLSLLALGGLALLRRR